VRKRRRVKERGVKEKKIEIEGERKWKEKEIEGE
jgi:hypothetical protein